MHVTRGSEPDDIKPIPPAAEIESGPLTGLLHRLSVLFGVQEPHLAHYEEAVRRNGSVVQADALDEMQAATARDTLLALGAVNIDDRVAEWEREGWRGHAADTGAARSASAAGAVVHRQEISIGGVRVYGHVVVVAFDELADEFRAHHLAQPAGEGGAYEDFEPAYRFGHALAQDQRNEGLLWPEIEREARAEWERRHPRSAWERFKGAVRHAWERATQ